MNISKYSPGDTAHCLAAVMRASPCEIILIDAATLRLVDANAAACANLQYDLPHLQSMTLQQVAPQLSRAQLEAALAGATGDIGELDTLQRRSDGSRYRLTLRLTHSLRDSRALIVAVGVRPAEAAQADATAPDRSQPRWNAIAGWQDAKWINLRSAPHALPDGAVQWDGIMSNVTCSRQEQHDVPQSQARLAELKNYLENGKEQERTRIAREIHDDLGGNLTAIKMALAMLSQVLPPENLQLQQRAAYVDALVDRSIDAMHRISLDLRPSVLDFGIVAALEWQIKEFETQTGVHCTLKSNQADIELGLDQATALFRIFQEALTNIAKHAKASRVAVRLARMRHHVCLKITDNGLGMVAADRAKPKSFGIRGMMERARALGGSVTLSAAGGGGTVVSIKIASGAPATIEHDVHADEIE